MQDPVTNYLVEGRKIKYDFQAQCAEVFIALCRYIKKRLDKSAYAESSGGKDEWAGISVMAIRRDDWSPSERPDYELLDALLPVRGDKGRIDGYEMGIGLRLEASTDSTARARVLYVQVQLMSEGELGLQQLYLRGPEYDGKEPIYLPLVLVAEEPAVIIDMLKSIRGKLEAPEDANLASEVRNARRALQQLSFFPHGALRMLETVERTLTSAKVDRGICKANVDAVLNSLRYAKQSESAIEAAAKVIAKKIKMVLEEGREAGITRRPRDQPRAHREPAAVSMAKSGKQDKPTLEISVRYIEKQR